MQERDRLNHRQDLIEPAPRFGPIAAENVRLSVEFRNRSAVAIRPRLAKFHTPAASPERGRARRRAGAAIEALREPDATPRELPRVAYDGKQYFVDRRLNELRARDNPHDAVRPIADDVKEA